MSQLCQHCGNIVAFALILPQLSTVLKSLEPLVYNNNFSKV